MKPHERRELVNTLTQIARDYGQTQQLRERIAHALPFDCDVIDAPSVEDARKIVAVGGPTDDAERLAFEAWIVERCWDMQCVRWDGSGYRSPAAIIERRMWAAWRDRAALSKLLQTYYNESAEDIAKKLK